MFLARIADTNVITITSLVEGSITKEEVQVVSDQTCRNAKELHLLLKHWCVPFIEVFSERCTSGLVAGNRNSEEHTQGKPS